MAPVPDKWRQYFNFPNILLFGVGCFIGLSMPLSLLLVATLLYSRDVGTDAEPSKAEQIPTGKVNSAQFSPSNSSVPSGSVTNSTEPSKPLNPTDLKVAGKDSKASFFAFPERTHGAGYDEVEGKLAVICDKNGLLVYDMDDVVEGKVAAVVRPLPFLPNHVCVKKLDKKSYFVVSALDSPKLLLFDSKTLEAEPEIELEGVSGIKQLAASENPDDPFIYFIAARKEKTLWSQQLGRYDLRNKSLQGPSNRTFDHFAISRDGQSIIADGVPLLDIDSAFIGHCRMTNEDPQNSRSGRMQLAPFDLGPGIGWTNTAYYSSGTEFVIPEFAFRSRPVLVGKKGKNVSLFTVGTMNEVEKKPETLLGMDDGRPRTESFGIREIEIIEIPQSWYQEDAIASSTPDYRPRTYTQISGDDLRGLALIVVNRNLAVAKLATLVSKPTDHPKHVIHPMPTLVKAGTKIEFEFGGPSDATIEVVSATRKSIGNSGSIKEKQRYLGQMIRAELDDSPTITNRRFEWNPSHDQIGGFDIRFRSSIGGDQREWIWSTNVVSPSTSPGFYATGMEWNQEETQAVIWGQSHIDLDEFAKSQSELPHKFYLAVYDWKNKKASKTIEVKKPIYAAALDDKSIFVCHCELPVERGPQQPAAAKISRYEIATAKVTATCDIEKHGQISIVGDCVIADGRAFNRDSLKSVSTKYVPDMAKRFSASKVGDNLMVDGVLWDASRKNPLLLGAFVGPGIKQSYLLRSLFGQSVWVTENGPVLYRWNSGLASSEIKGIPSMTIDDPRTRHASKHYPGYFATIMGALQVIDASSVKGGTSIPFQFGRDLMGGGQEPVSRQHRVLPFGPSADYLTSNAESVFAVAGGRIYEIPVKLLASDQKVLQFEEKQSTFILPFGKQVEVAYTAPGATKFALYLKLDREFSLGSGKQKPDIELESENGRFEFKLNDRAVVKEIVCKLVQTSIESPDAKLLKAYRDKLIPEIAKISKTPIQGIPFPVSAVVLAENEGQTACLAHDFIVDIPTSVFINKNAKAK